MHITAMIPARMGSERLKQKNLALLDGKPLISYAINAANESQAFDQVVVNSDGKVMSQIATKVCCLLDDDRDVDAVMTGTSGNRELRAVLAGLESKQQALVFGNAVPIPVAVLIRDYGTSDSYDSLMRVARHRRSTGSPAKKESTSTGPKEDDEDELFG